MGTGISLRVNSLQKVDHVKSVDHVIKLVLAVDATRAPSRLTLRCARRGLYATSHRTFFESTLGHQGPGFN